MIKLGVIGFEEEYEVPISHIKEYIYQHDL